MVGIIIYFRAIVYLTKHNSYGVYTQWDLLQ
jgi:hypothetical protein